MTADATPSTDKAIRIAAGWLEHGSKKDAVEYAKGYAGKHFDAPEMCWYAVCPLLDGWLFEIQEGGAGVSYLPPLASALSRGAEQSWFPSGNRAYSITLRDGRPSCILLAEDISKQLMANEEAKLEPRGSMTRVVKRGSRVLAFGTVVFTTGFLFLAASGGFHAASQVYAPKDRQLDLKLLPHRAWSEVTSVPTTMFVETLRLDLAAKKWSTTTKQMAGVGGGQRTTPPAAQAPSAAAPVVPSTPAQTLPASAPDAAAPIPGPVAPPPPPAPAQVSAPAPTPSVTQPGRLPPPPAPDFSSEAQRRATSQMPVQPVSASPAPPPPAQAAPASGLLAPIAPLGR